MRTIALCLSITLLACSASSAQEFVNEPVGQKFSPPPVRIELQGMIANNSLTNRAKNECAAAVADIYQSRAAIYVACLRKQLEPTHKVIVMNDAKQVAERYGVKLD